MAPGPLRARCHLLPRAQPEPPSTSSSPRTSSAPPHPFPQPPCPSSPGGGWKRWGLHPEVTSGWSPRLRCLGAQAWEPTLLLMGLVCGRSLGSEGNGGTKARGQGLELGIPGAGRHLRPVHSCILPGLQGGGGPSGWKLAWFSCGQNRQGGVGAAWNAWLGRSSRELMRWPRRGDHGHPRASSQPGLGAHEEPEAQGGPAGWLCS